MEDRLPRKLAAILYADVAGYARLTGEDEDATHLAVSEYLDLISAIIQSHRGQVMHYAGDAVLAKFEAVVDALSGAVAIQDELRTRNQELPTEQKVQFRIGVNLGDVIEDRGDIYGDGVNVAARLETLAEPGSICVSESVRTAVGKKLDLHYADLGEQKVKNIAEPLRAYRVVLETGSASATRPQLLGWQTMGAIAVVAVLIVVGVITWWQRWQPREEPASVERMTFPLPNKPSIAVLPFTNMSDDSSQEYFVDGMTDDLITDLSKLSGLFVIARNSPFSYKGQSVKVNQVAEELGVRYVLEGSVRRAGEQVRINAQLIDAKTGGHLWAERYDGSVADVFALQDKVTQEIVNALAIRLTEDDEARAKRDETDNPDAYDAFLAGWARYRHYTKDDFAKAKMHFERALELDPNYSRAHAALAAVYIESRWNRWRVSDHFFRDTNQLSRLHLQKAMKSPTALAYRIASFINILEGRPDETMENAKRAIALDPNDPNAYEAVGRALIYAGKPAESLDYIERAERLDPRSSYLYLRGVAQFHLEQYKKSAATILKYVEIHSDSWLPFLYLASAYGYLGQESKAKSAFESFRKIREDQGFYVGSNALDQVAILYFKIGGIEEKRLREGLRKAGFDASPEVLESSSEGIRLRKSPYGTVARVYKTAEEHCQAHGKESLLISASAFPTFGFQCR